MASGDERAAIPDGLSGAGLRIGVVSARWNTAIVDRLAEGVTRGLTDLGVTEIVEATVPGSFEVPFGALAMAESGQVDAVVCIGVVIRGGTTHYELVSEGAAEGIQQVQLATAIPVTFGLLTVENEEQSIARSEGAGGHNVGEEAAQAAVEMARLKQRFA